LVSACTSDQSSVSGPTVTCGSTSTTLALSPGQYTALDPSTDSGCVAFPANGSTSDSAEYVVVALSAGGDTGATSPFLLRSTTATGTPLLDGPRVASRRAAARGSIAVAFDRYLRTLGRAQRGRAPVRAPAAVTPPTVGALRAFSVCANGDCSVFKTVTARARSVGTHVAMYVDTLTPAGGLDSAQIDSLRQLFDSHVYAVDTTAFGGVSDVDSNGVVIVLMTPVVNALVTTAECNSGGYVVGFFFPPDLDPTNPSRGEIFYTIVADPSGKLSCPHTVDDVEFVLPGTFLHELQHLISFNQHVLVRGGDEEDLWLDEALSSFAEELGGRSFLPDTDTFLNYMSGDFYNAYQYLLAPGTHFLLQTSDTVLADFGAGWMFIRYLADQYGTSITNKLVETSLTGTANVETQTGVPFPTTAARWALANWVSDLPGFVPAPELQYASWSFRPLFAALSVADPFDFPVAFPLAPIAGPGAQVNLADTLHAGSGYYRRVLQGPGGAGFTLKLAGPSAVVNPRLVVLRVR